MHNGTQIMYRFLLSLTIFFAVAFTTTAQTPDHFNHFFTTKALRVDYFHTGTKTEECFSLDQVYEEPQWTGSKVNLIDTLNMGEYLVKVFDVKTNQYSEGIDVNEFCIAFKSTSCYILDVRNTKNLGKIATGEHLFLWKSIYRN
jgi:hypothetical protein